MMVFARFDPLVAAVDLNHDETQKLLNGGFTEEFSGLVKGALVASGVAAAAAGVVTAAVAAYVAIEMALIRRLDQGNGVTLTLPWLLGIVIPSTRDAKTNTPTDAWAQSDEGVLVSSGGDEVTYRIERGAIQPDIAQFWLQNRIPSGWPPGSPAWDKALIIRDGTGGDWEIKARAHEASQNSLGADVLGNGQPFTFRKPGFAGVWIEAFSVTGIEHVKGGDRVTFTWVKDWH